MRLLEAGEIKVDYLEEVMVDIDCEGYTQKSMFREEGVVP